MKINTFFILLLIGVSFLPACTKQPTYVAEVSCEEIGSIFVDVNQFSTENSFYYSWQKQMLITANSIGCEGAKTLTIQKEEGDKIVTIFKVKVLQQENPGQIRIQKE